jgi:hypothetical protein
MDNLFKNAETNEHDVEIAEMQCKPATNKYDVEVARARHDPTAKLGDVIRHLGNPAYAQDVERRFLAKTNTVEIAQREAWEAILARAKTITTAVDAARVIETTKKCLADLRETVRASIAEFLKEVKKTEQAKLEMHMKLQESAGLVRMVGKGVAKLAEERNAILQGRANACKPLEEQLRVAQKLKMRIDTAKQLIMTIVRDDDKFSETERALRPDRTEPTNCRCGRCRHV